MIQPWARDGDAETWVRTVTLTQYNTDVTSINDAIQDVIDGTTPVVETDPTVPDHVKAITTTDISNWDSGAGTDLTGYATESWVNTQGFATETWVNGQSFCHGVVGQW